MKTKINVLEDVATSTRDFKQWVVVDLHDAEDIWNRAKEIQQLGYSWKDIEFMKTTCKFLIIHGGYNWFVMLNNDDQYETACEYDSTVGTFAECVEFIKAWEKSYQ